MLVKHRNIGGVSICASIIKLKSNLLVQHSGNEESERDAVVARVGETRTYTWMPEERKKNEFICSNIVQLSI